MNSENATSKRVFPTEEHVVAQHSNRNGIGDGRINDGSGVAHDSAALGPAEAVNEGPHRPFHDGGDHERQEPERGPHHLAPARVAGRATLDTYRHLFYQCSELEIMKNHKIEAMNFLPSGALLICGAYRQWVGYVAPCESARLDTCLCKMGN
ncbi:hypothetical protein Acr_05g0003750 [Actinidia rufa]|uniref:Uncharacterized protein n=1 Tax=Actinidia rufa TaxID=165716 RepID=A0A7J0EKJ5_9ERIC|nr:hypothetical protein Acr_05g0003750 [Actinidia rufa]